MYDVHHLTVLTDCEVLGWSKGFKNAVLICSWLLFTSEDEFLAFVAQLASCLHQNVNLCAEEGTRP